MTSEPVESEGQRRPWYPGRLDPGRRAFYLAMLTTALVTIGLMVLVFSTWPPRCWRFRCL